MAKTMKIVTAGPYQKKILYSRGHRSDSPKQRAAKRRASSEAQKRLNLKNSREKLKLTLAAAFPTAGSGWVCVLTYRDECLPHSWDEATAIVNEFRKSMRRERRRLGLPFLMASNIEEHSSRHQRLHHHAVINNTGEDFALIRRCWKWGEVLEFHPMWVDKEQNWETLAAYMTKETPEKLGKHGWTATRNCPKPEVETFTVSDDTTLQAPAGTHLISSERRRDEWASWELIEYVFPTGQRPPKAKRRRKR